MEQEITCDGEKVDVGELFEARQKAVGDFAKEVAEREFEILELNFMISSQITKKDSERTDKHLNSLREKVRNKEVNIEKANEYIECLQ